LINNHLNDANCHHYFVLTAIFVLPIVILFRKRNKIVSKICYKSGLLYLYKTIDQAKLKYIYS